VAKVNRMFWDVVPNGLFASLFFGVFDLEASALAFVNAGHHYPFLMTAQGEVRDLVQGGTVLGLVEDSAYEQGSVSFRPGRPLRVLQRRNHRPHEPAGRALRRGAPQGGGGADGTDSSARITLYSLLGEVQGWSAGAPAEDDMTLVVAAPARSSALGLLLAAGEDPRDRVERDPDTNQVADVVPGWVRSVRVRTGPRPRPVREDGDQAGQVASSVPPGRGPLRTRKGSGENVSSRISSSPERYSLRLSSASRFASVWRLLN
jgi:hypothetical protein